MQRALKTETMMMTLMILFFHDKKGTVMNIIKRMDEQVKSYTGWLDAKIGEKSANLTRENLYISILVLVVDEIAKEFFGYPLPLLVWPPTFVSILGFVTFVNITSIFLRIALGRPDREDLAKRVKVQNA